MASVTTAELMFLLRSYNRAALQQKAAPTICIKKETALMAPDHITR